MLSEFGLGGDLSHGTFIDPDGDVLRLHKN